MPSSVNTLNLVFIEKTHLFFFIIISVLLTSNSDEQDVEVKDLDEILESWFTKTKCFPLHSFVGINLRAIIISLELSVLYKLFFSFNGLTLMINGESG